VTAHWRHADLLRSRFPKLHVEPDVLYVDEGNILTSAGSTAGIDLCLHIVRLDYGAEIANEIARRLVMPPHRAGAQAQNLEDPLRGEANGGLAAILGWAQAHLAEAVRVEDLARRAAMSPRSFARRFRQQTGTTPHRWLMHQRLIEAQRRLEKTDAGIDQIAAAVGLQTAASLRLHFSKVLGTSPTAYRRRFGSMAAELRAVQ
jgi:transcriptional regulator GlxA family with amidase domain